MAQDEIFVAIWTLADGHSVQTLTDRPSYHRWLADPTGYAQKRLQRWNSPNRPIGSRRLSKAQGFQIVPYVRSRSSSGHVPVAR